MIMQSDFVVFQEYLLCWWCVESQLLKFVCENVIIVLCLICLLVNCIIGMS